MSIPPLPPALRALPRRRLSGPPAATRPRAAEPGGLPPIERLSRGGPLPASPYQQWAWEALRGKASADLNIPFAVRFTLPLSLAALLASLRELERRHEGLRTRLVRDLGEPWTVRQVIDPPGGLAVPLIDLSRLRRAPRERELGRLASEDAARPIDLAAQPMFRAAIVRLGDADHAVLLNLGHLIGDGWSVGILRGELAALYAALAAGRTSPLAEPAIQFADFAGWQRQIRSGAVVAGQLEYWRRRLAAAPIPLLLPGDLPGRPPPGRGTVQAVCRFAPPVTARIRGLARAEGATPPMVVLAALGLLLAAYTGETDILIEAKALGRTLPELVSVVGLFMGTLAHRTDLSGRPGFAEALRRTRDGVVEDYCNQDLPFPELLRELFPGRRYLSRVALNMLSFPTATPLAAWERQQEVFAHEGRWPDLAAPKYDLLVTGLEDRDQLWLLLAGTAARFRAETVADIAADLEALIARALDEPEAPLARLLPAPRYRHARPAAP